MGDLLLWKPYKALYDIINEPRPAATNAAKTAGSKVPQDTPESFARAASLIFSTLRRFPDALLAVREALRPLAPPPIGIPA